MVAELDLEAQDAPPAASILPTPAIFRPFSQRDERRLRRHVAEVRRCFDWPGIPYHDANEVDPEKVFHRWFWHNLPLLQAFHHRRTLIDAVVRMFGEALRPSYVFLSMYGPDGVCPLHTDRPQCHVTIDYLISTDAREKPWPIYIDDTPYVLKPGEAVMYSGTRQPHYRKSLREDSDATYANLAFFHFVPVTFAGSVQ